jgi:hypothetical protein
MFSNREQRAKLSAARDSLEVQRLIAGWEPRPAH